MWIIFYGLLEIILYFWFIFIALDMFELYIVGGSSRNRRRLYRNGYPTTSHLINYLARLPATHSPIIDGRILRHALRTGQLSSSHAFTLNLNHQLENSSNLGQQL
ncbi:hypothetical protein DMENIID0001_145680 [Sergentomyia squamirostris]